MVKRIGIVKDILIFLFVIVFIVGVIVVYYSMLYKETKEKITKSEELSSVISAEQIDKYLAKGFDFIKLLSYTLDNMLRDGRTSEEIHDYLVDQSTAVLNTTSENSTGVYGFINGDYLDGTNWVPDDDFVPTERPWYIAARANVGRVALVDPYIDAQTQTLLITFSKTLCDAKSVVAMDYALDRLQVIIEDITEVGAFETEILLDQKNQVIAHSDKSEIGKNYSLEENSFGHEIISKLDEANEGFLSLHYDGKDYIIYSVNVSNDWVCLSIYDATSVYSQLRATLGFTIAAVLLVVIIFLSALVFSIRRQAHAKLQSVVGALAAAIDAKDKYTNGHSSRVAEYSKEIAKRYGYSFRKQDDIYLMGLLHDVGKIGIPDNVINKPSRLTDEEYDIIKTHTTIGFELLSNSVEMEKMAIGARWHHERYDGTGYPDKLAGEDIKEEARIIAVADAYDAMTSKRSYRDSLPFEVVKAEIEKGKGKQFDPVFAEIMIQIAEERK